ncbi:MAG: HEPN domain-containing protein [Candidatus Omnitrophica bacterium]|nr:HEPN domain-containing protein [Candidatus Omnitrophota bacterium]
MQKARQDLRRVSRRLAENDVEDAAFHLQQAIEKFLKGYLLSHGWSLKKIHDLEALLDDAIRVSPDLEAYRELCQQVTGYYFIERYPALGVPPTAEEVRSDYRLAQRLARWVRERIK